MSASRMRSRPVLAIFSAALFALATLTGAAAGNGKDGPVSKMVAGVEVTATVLNQNQVRVDWTSTLSPQPASWTVGRDGFDNRGSGPWSTTVSGTVRTWTFNSLITGQQYTFTVTPAGSTQGFTATATPGGTTPPPGGTAQETQGWGTPVWQDDFNGTAVSSQWNLYTDPKSQHGNRQPSQCQVSGGTLKLVSLPDRRTCGMSHDRDQTHGRWEARVRTSGAGWKSLFIIWPESDEWNDGEYDWMEQTAGGNCYGGFMHYPGDPRRQEVLPQNSASCVGSTQWHHVAFEWTATSLKGWIDGRLWYTIPAMGTLTRMPAGHVTIQQDDQGSGSGNSALQEVDWIKGWDL